MTIQRQVGIAQLGIAAVKAAADQSANSSQQFRQGKRFSKIVISTGVQPSDPLLDQASGGEHQNGCFDALLPELTADLQATHARQSNVQKDSVVGNVCGF